MKQDKSQDAYMQKCGYRVLRIWESDFKDIEDVRRKIADTLTCT